MTVNNIKTTKKMKTLIMEILKKTEQIFISSFLAILIITILPTENVTAKSSGEITADISLPTIQCGTCEKNISKALDKVKGLKSYSVDIENRKVTVTYDDGKTSVSKIENAISKTGYDANNKKADKKAYDKLNDCCKVQEDR